MYSNMINYGLNTSLAPVDYGLGDFNSMSSYGLQMPGSSGASGLGLQPSSDALSNWGTSSLGSGSNSNPLGTVNGWMGTAAQGMDLLKGLTNIYLGMKQYGLMKKQLAENRRQFNLNYEAQKNLINTRMKDRQEARVAANPTAYQSVDEYMKQNGIQ